MTYGNLKYLVKSLLIGDSTLTKDNSEVLVLLDYAFDRVSNEADVMKLFTANNVENRIVRQGPGKMWVRRPNLPETDDEELDIDHELCFAVAEYMCSFVSRDKRKDHAVAALDLVRTYNQKVQTFFENLAQDGDLEDHDSNDKFGKRDMP